MHPCPRCNYDLSGTITTWTAASPLTILCTECGRESRSADILSRTARAPRWSFEHSRLPTPRRWLLTSLATLFPRLLWRGLKITDETNLPRLTFLALSWFVLVHFGLGLALELLAALAPLRVVNYTSDHPIWLWPYSVEIELPTPSPNTFTTNNSPGSIVIILAWAALTPLALALMTIPRTRRLPRRHIARVALLSAPPTLLLIPLHFAGLPAVIGRSAAPDESLLGLASMITAIFWCPVVIAAWWREALARYFKVRKTGLMGVGLFACTLLLFIACIVLADPGI